MTRPRLVYVVTHPVSADLLLRGQLAFMREHGFDVTVVSAPGPELERVKAREGVSTVAIPMARRGDPLRDVGALREMTSLFRSLRPHIVNAGTTKGGLLGMIAARAASVPIRIYLLRGLRLETQFGVMRRILGVTERIACACAHDVVCVSPSLMALSVGGGYIPKSKASVLGAGSSNGVDAQIFRRDDALRAIGAKKMAELGIADGDGVIGFVGRLAWDKGITELLDAFQVVRRRVPNAKLALLGGNMGGEVAEDAFARRVRSEPGVALTGSIADLAPYFARMNVLAFPSLREGFPNVPLEAASAEVPVVGFRSTGVVDCVADGVTGQLVAQRDVEGLARGLVAYLESPELARTHGRAGRARVNRLFTRAHVWNAWLEAYRVRLTAKGLPLPASEEPSARVPKENVVD